MLKRKITDAKNDKKGNISHVQLEGNKNFTSKQTAIGMAERGEIDAVVVTQANGDKHLRTRPDGKEKNNLDTLAGDTKK
jgi:hypothetical protein